MLGGGGIEGIQFWGKREGGGVEPFYVVLNVQGHEVPAREKLKTGNGEMFGICVINVLR